MIINEDSNHVFQSAIDAGFLSADPAKDNYAGKYMYMGTHADGFAEDIVQFKNINDRSYNNWTRPAQYKEKKYNELKSLKAQIAEEGFRQEITNYIANQIGGWASITNVETNAGSCWITFADGAVQSISIQDVETGNEYTPFENKYVVLENTVSGWVASWGIEEVGYRRPDTYDTRKEAEEEVNQTIIDIAEEIEAGNMDADSLTTLDEYLIIFADMDAAGNIIGVDKYGKSYTCKWEG